MNSKKDDYIKDINFNVIDAFDESDLLFLLFDNKINLSKTKIIFKKTKVSVATYLNCYRKEFLKKYKVLKTI